MSVVLLDVVELVSLANDDVQFVGLEVVVFEEDYAVVFVGDDYAVRLVDGDDGVVFGVTVLVEVANDPEIDPVDDFLDLIVPNF